MASPESEIPIPGDQGRARQRTQHGGTHGQQRPHQQVELPERLDPGRGEESRRHQAGAATHDLPNRPVVHHSPQMRGDRRDHHVHDHQPRSHTEAGASEFLGEGLEEDAIRVEDEPDGDEVRQEDDSNDPPAVEHGPSFIGRC
jgi:hypothetical protein